MVKFTFFLAAAAATSSVLAASVPTEGARGLDTLTPLDVTASINERVASEEAEDDVFDLFDDEEDFDDFDEEDTSLVGSDTGLQARQTSLTCGSPGIPAPRSDVLRCISRMDSRSGIARMDRGSASRTLCGAGRAQVVAMVSSSDMQLGLGVSWKNLANTVRYIYNNCKKGSNWANGGAGAIGNSRIRISLVGV